MTPPSDPTRSAPDGGVPPKDEKFATLADVLELLPIGASVVDRGGKLIYANSAICRMLGYAKEELVGRSPLELTHPEDIEPSRHALQRAIEGSQPSFSLEKRYLHRDGRVLWGRTTVSLRQLSNGATYTVGTTDDITEEKRTQTLIQVLAESTRSDRGEFFDVLTQALATSLGVSHAFVTETKDHQRTQVRTLSFWSDGRHVDPIEYGLEETPCERVARDGDDVFYAGAVQEAFPNDPDLVSLGAEAYYGVPLLDAHGTPLGHLAILHHDRLDSAHIPREALRIFAARASAELSRTRAEFRAQRLAEQEQHRQKVESLGLLAGGIAHDFNNVLMGVLGNADLARTETSDGSRVQGLLDSIIESARQAGELARQLLDYAGGGTDPVERVDLSELVRGCRPLLATANTRKVQVRLDLDEQLPALRAAPGQLRQVLLNLWTNAVESMDDNPAGTVTIRTDAVDIGTADLPRFITPVRAGRFVRLLVSDTGSGMDVDTQSRMFDPFFSTKTTGRGLGSGVILSIVDRHSGTLAVQSNPGDGTTVEVLLPTPQANHDHKPKPETARGTVLVVDDDAMVRQVCCQFLHLQGFEVVDAADGEAGVAAFRDAHARGAPFTAVCLDLVMPRLNGSGAFRAIRAIDPEAVVILWTGYDAENQLEPLQAEGLNGVLCKPFDQRQLTAALDRALRSARP